MQINIKDLLFEGGIIYPFYHIPFVQKLRKLKWKRSAARAEDLGTELENIKTIIGNFEKSISDVLPSVSFFKDKVILEVGPGCSCGVSLYFLARGARKAVMVDRERRFFVDEQDDRVIREICEYLEGAYSVEGLYTKAMLKEDTKLQFNPEAIEMHYSGITSVPLPDNSVDFIFSNAVLEHVTEPEPALSEMHRLLKPGSYMTHDVDLRVHGPIKKTNPLAHLNYTPWEWRILTARKMSYTNRLRLCHFEAIIKEAGFDIEHLRVTLKASEETVEKNRHLFHDDYKTMSEEDLRPLGFFFVARKVA